MANTNVLTDKYRLEFFTRRELVARYRYVPDTLPGFDLINAFDTRALTAPHPSSGMSLWVSHGNVNGVAFGTKPESRSQEAAEEEQGQEMDAPQDDVRNGRLVSLGLTVRRGALSVGFQQECAWLTPNDTVMLRDQRTVRLSPGPAEGSVLDFTLRLSAPDNHSVSLGRTDKSLLRLSLASALLPVGGGQLRNGAGDYGPEEMNGRSAGWCAGVGVVRGETVGLALLDHPDNRWHPPRWTVSPEGLLAPQPFSWSAMELEPGEPFRLRYRIYTYSGYIDAGWAEARLAEFADEPMHS